MKKLLALLLTTALLFGVSGVGACAAAEKMTPQLADEVDSLADGEEITVALWTVIPGEFRSSIELTEYVNRLTYEECGLTAGSCHTLDQVNTYSKVYNRILHEIESANVPDVLDALGLSDTDVVDHACNMLILSITKEQIVTAAALDQVALIERWDEPPWEEPFEYDDDQAEDDLDGKDPVRVKNPGDADGDGTVTVMDATRIQRWLAELENDAEGVIAINGDADGDEAITVLDVTRIQRCIAGLCRMDGNVSSRML